MRFPHHRSTQTCRCATRRCPSSPLFDHKIHKTLYKLNGYVWISTVTRLWLINTKSLFGAENFLPFVSINQMTEKQIDGSWPLCVCVREYAVSHLELPRITHSPFRSVRRPQQYQFCNLPCESISRFPCLLQCSGSCFPSKRRIA